MVEEKRLLTGARPTGPLHLGHYVGTLSAWVKEQHNYEMFLIIADLHMLTTKNSKEDIGSAAKNARQMVADCIAAGIEPEAVSFYLQSAIPEIYEIYTLLQSLVAVTRLERIPSLKEMARGLSEGVEMPFALLGYPILQSADVLCAKAHAVPVGKDNVAHLEITREIARKFNNKYGQEVFPIPDTLLTDSPSLVGLDGKAKMSKSLNNAIFLSDEKKAVEKKVNSIYTDPNRVHANIPGTVEGNPVFDYHDAFTKDVVQVTEMKERYREGKISDREVKAVLFESLESLLQPMRERRKEVDARSGYVDKVIVEGTERTRDVVRTTLKDMKKAMGVAGVRNSIWRKAEKTN